MTDLEFMQKHITALSEGYCTLLENYKQVLKEVGLIRETLNQHIGVEVKTAKIIQMIPRKLKKVERNSIL